MGHGLAPPLLQLPLPQFQEWLPYVTPAPEVGKGFLLVLVPGAGPPVVGFPELCTESVFSFHFLQ